MFHKNFWNFIILFIGVLLIVFGLGIMYYNYCNSLNGIEGSIFSWFDYFKVASEQIAPELIGGGITVILIDTIYELKEKSQIKRVLMRNLKSGDNSITIQSLIELDELGLLQNGFLKNKSITNANFEKAEFPIKVNFSDSRLEKANFKNAVLHKAIFHSSDLRGANLSNSILTFANLKGAILAGANLENANLSGANLNGASLQNANLKGAILKNCIIEGWNIDDIITDENTIFPKNN